MRSWRSGALAVLLATASCGEPGQKVLFSSLAERDSAGVHIVEYGTLDSSADLLAATVPVTRIGRADGPLEYLFYGVADAKRLSDGAFAVINRGTSELRLYEPDGTHRATGGRAGQGPAEFRSPGALVVLPGDTIQVQDYLLAGDYHDRVYFAADGSFIRRETTDRRKLARIWEQAAANPMGSLWLPANTLLVPLHGPVAKPFQAGPSFRPPFTLLRVSADLATVDTVGIFEGLRQQYVDVAGERGVVQLLPPFPTSTDWSFDPVDGTIVVGNNALPQLELYRPDGTRSIVRWAAEPIGISSAEIDAWKEQRRAQQSNPDRLAELERGFAGLDMSGTKPLYQRISVGSDGSIWLTLTSLDALQTDLIVFDKAGRFSGSVSIPGAFRFFDSGDGWLLGHVRDENGVEYLHVYALRPHR